MSGDDIQQALGSIGYSGRSDDDCARLANTEKIAISFSSGFFASRAG